MFTHKQKPQNEKQVHVMPNKLFNTIFLLFLSSNYITAPGIGSSVVLKCSAFSENELFLI